MAMTNQPVPTPTPGAPIPPPEEETLVPRRRRRSPCSEAQSDATQLLTAIRPDEATSSADLLPLVYEELRRLAASRLAREQPGHTLQPTALVHEAYLRLSGSNAPCWTSRRHFFCAAAEAMRRILIEHARRKKRQKHGGGHIRMNLDEVCLPAPMPDDELLSLHEALQRLEDLHPRG